ncbi:MAG: nitrogenase component 1 [Ignavibacteria bacterium]|jgi:nitrogenase molybdenum-iron protein NifN
MTKKKSFQNRLVQHTLNAGAIIITLKGKTVQTFEINTANRNSSSKYEATQDACKLCTPLGACIAFKGIENAVSLIHGSQGCSTYIRRYLISHFREPIDIASSNFSEETAIYGGEENLLAAVKNVISQYKPSVIGIPTTCLSETIGDDVKMIIKSFSNKIESFFNTTLIPVSTPSYKGTHADGFHLAVKSIVEKISGDEKRMSANYVPVFHSLQSPADIRHLKEITTGFGFEPCIFPDYSETLDGGLWDRYEKIPSGGMPFENIEKMGSSLNSIEFGEILEEQSASSYLSEEFGVVKHTVNIPIGIKNCDAFFDTLKLISGKPIPQKFADERSRLVDSYIDGHKYLFGKRALIYGEEEFVVSLAVFLSEIGIDPAICASGSTNKTFKNKLAKNLDEPVVNKIQILDDSDFVQIKECAEKENINLVIGNSKGYKISRALSIPLVRVGFPIHDRIGAQRILHVGYRGTQQLFDKITNAIIEYKQENSETGYSYI